jgi:rhamnosyltransferase
MPKVSVIIPTLNAQGTIGRLLEYLTQQDVHIFIIDSSSTDKTVEIIKSFGVAYIVIEQEAFDHGGTRTLGAQHCMQSEFLIYLTQDAYPYNEKSIENILRPFENQSVGAVCGRQVAYPNEGVFGRHLRAFNYSKQSHIRTYEDRSVYGIKTPFLSNSFAAYRYTMLKEIGFFKDGLIFGEDMYVAAKMLQKGYAVAYQADAIVFHSHTYSYKQELQRYFDMGVFHTQESWLLEDFGKAEGEGRRFVLDQIKFLYTHNKLHLLASMVIRTSFKLLGYKLGRNYKYLPQWVLQRSTMNAKWWKI